MDTIGDVGKSVLADPAQQPMNGAELASWLCQVAARLGIERRDVVAGSYGSWLVVLYAIFASARADLVMARMLEFLDSVARIPK